MLFRVKTNSVVASVSRIRFEPGKCEGKTELEPEKGYPKRRMGNPAAGWQSQHAANAPDGNPSEALWVVLSG
jgi:hypothetical protein